MSLPAGARLFECGQPAEQIVFVVGGLVMLTRSEDDGNEVGLGLVGSRGVVGLAAALAATVHSATAGCVTRCHVRQAPASQFDEAVRSDTAARRWLMTELARTEAAAIEHTMLLAIHSTTGRLRRLIRLLAEVSELRAADGGLQLCPPLHQRDLALLIGRAPEKLSASVGALRRTGVASVGRGGRLAVPPQSPLLSGSARPGARVDDRQDRT